MQLGFVFFGWDEGYFSYIFPITELRSAQLFDLPPYQLSNALYLQHVIRQELIEKTNLVLKHVLRVKIYKKTSTMCIPMNIDRFYLLFQRWDYAKHFIVSPFYLEEMGFDLAKVVHKHPSTECDVENCQHQYIRAVATNVTVRATRSI